MFTILPPTVWTSVAQPTEQYGQMLGTVFASLIRNSSARASVGARSAPRPARPPSAVPVAVVAERRKKSRRESSISSPRQGESKVERAIAVPVGKAIPLEHDHGRGSFVP